jgi:hypothetical protein
MPILGLLLGCSLASALGRGAHWIGGCLPIATGGYAVIQAVRTIGREKDLDAPDAVQSLSRLVITGLALWKAAINGGLDSTWPWKETAAVRSGSGRERRPRFALPRVIVLSARSGGLCVGYMLRRRAFCARAWLAPPARRGLG